MSAVKTTTLYGCLAKVESTYNGGATLSTTDDGLLLAEPPGIPAKSYLFDGSRGRAPGTGGWRKGAAPAGGARNGALKVHIRGRGAAYDDSPVVVPYDIDLLMRASGHGRTISATGGSESVTYAPHTGPASFESIALQWYNHGDLYKIKGVYGSVRLSADGVGLPVCEFEFDGVEDLSAYAESLAVPSITVNDTVIPPTAEGMTIALGDYTGAIVRGFTFDAARSRSPRQNVATSGGHAGWTLGERAPTLEVRIEKPALTGNPYHAASAFDAYRLWAVGTPLAVSLACGGTQYNRWTLACPTAQLMGVTEEEDGGTAILALTFRVHCSAPGTNDDYSLAFT